MKANHSTFVLEGLNWRSLLNWRYFAGCTLEQVYIGMALRGERTCGNLVTSYAQLSGHWHFILTENGYNCWCKSLLQRVKFRLLWMTRTGSSVVKNTYGILNSWLRQQELCWERAQGCPLRNLHRGEQSSAEGYRAHDVRQNLLLILNQHLALLQLCKTRYLENRKI